VQITDAGILVAMETLQKYPKNWKFVKMIRNNAKFKRKFGHHM